MREASTPKIKPCNLLGGTCQTKEWKGEVYIKSILLWHNILVQEKHFKRAILCFNAVVQDGFSLGWISLCFPSTLSNFMMFFPINQGEKTNEDEK